jgi:hypothetical protein
MKKQKRLIIRPWGRRRRGGWIINPESLIKVLKDGDAVQMGEITVGTRNLVKIIRGMELPENELLLLKCNGNLEISNIGLRYIPNPKGPNPRKGQYYTLKPKLRNTITLHNKAWLKGDIGKLLVLRPKKF